MNNKTGQYLIFGAGVLIVLFFAVVFFLSPKQVSWSITYDEDSNEPYGYSLLTNILKNKDGAFTEGKLGISEVLNKNEKEKTLYFIAGYTAYYTNDDLDSLFRFIERGNEAFVSLANLPNSFIERLSKSFPIGNNMENKPLLKSLDSIVDVIENKENKADSAEQAIKNQSVNAIRNYYFNNSFTDSSLFVEFTHPAIESRVDSFNYIFDFEPSLRRWNSFGLNYKFNFADQDSLAVFLKEPHKGHALGLKFKIGQGDLYLHSEPLLMSNLYLAEENYLRHFSYYLSHFNSDKTYYDAFSKDFRFTGNQTPINSNPERNPLRVIYESPALRLAFYLIVALVLIHLLSNTRRRRGIIPILVPPENTSLLFTKTVAQLYYQNGSHRQLGKEKMKLFRGHLSKKYGISKKHKDDEIIKKLQIRTGIKTEEIEKIFRIAKRLEISSGFSESDLTALDRAIHNFYLKTT